MLVRNTQTDRQTDWQTDRQTDRETDRQSFLPPTQQCQSTKGRVTTLFQQWFSMTFFMTKKWISMTCRHSIFFQNEIRDHTAWNKMLLSYQTTNGNTGESEGQTMNNVHFYKKILRHHHHFPWLSMTFHDLGCFPWLSRPGNGLTKFHDFPGRVVTLW